MEFSEEEWSALIQRLRSLAGGDHVVWHSADGIGGEPFTAAVPSGTKFEVSTVDSDGMFPYRVRVVEEGIVVLEFVTPPSDRRSPHGDRASTDLHALYKMLARDLSGAKKKFDSLIGELDGLA